MQRHSDGPHSPALPGARVRPPRSAPLVQWRTWWPLFIVVALATAGAAVVNTLSVLSCTRADNRCTFTRGSLAFSYTEELFVTELVRATVEPAGSNVPNRDRDGWGERVYVHTKSESLRFLDNDEWSHERRLEEAARINAFIADPQAAALEVRFDRRARVLVFAFLVAAAFGGAWVGVKRGAARLTR